MATPHISDSIISIRVLTRQMLPHRNRAVEAAPKHRTTFLQIRADSNAMGLFKLKKSGQDKTGESGNVDDWLKTIDEDAENAAMSPKETSGLAPITGVDSPFEGASVEATPPPPDSSGATLPAPAPIPPTASDQTSPAPAADIAATSDIAEAGWHLPNLGANAEVAEGDLASSTLPDLGFSNQSSSVSPQEPLPPAWASSPDAAVEVDTVENTRPFAAPPLETAPPLEPGPEIESSSDGIIPRNIDLSLEGDPAADYELDDFGVVLDAPDDDQAHPFEPTGLAGRSRGRITETSGTIKVPEGDSVATLLAILGLDRDVSWDEVKQSHGALIADHLAAGESDPERAELARSIRREINSAYIALRLLQVP